MTWLSLLQRRPLSTAGTRIYAIGDIHGCYSLLIQLLQKIELDQRDRPERPTSLVLLGDYVDRGPRSREVCELLYSMRDLEAVHCLKGNHEQAMLDVLKGDERALNFWLRYGGEATLLSWGVPESLIVDVQHGREEVSALLAAFVEKVRPEMLAWLADLPEYLCLEDYIFVHAGIRPRVPLEEQVSEDLLWIREPFLSSRVKHPQMVVHGHTETRKPQLRANRIGIDTAAYRTGCLTAAGLEDGEHWFVHSDG
jgi:serine/threonine protein phosphatase 1